MSGDLNAGRGLPSRGVIDGGTDFYRTTLEPMQMLQAFRAGQPVVNHIFRPAQQFLPQALPSYTPPPQIVQAPRTFGLGDSRNGGLFGNPGPGVGATDGQDGAAAAADAAASGDGGGGSK